MFKFLPYYEKSNFVKRKQRNKPIRLENNMIFNKKTILLKKKLILIALKCLLKRVKKKKHIFFINVRLNLIKSFKSKNARMGKGKGIFKNQLIQVKQHGIFTVKNISTFRKFKITQFFKKKSILIH